LINNTTKTSLKEYYDAYNKKPELISMTTFTISIKFEGEYF